MKTELSVSNMVLAAKRQQIKALRRLASKSRLVGVIGHMIHLLQSERGASSIFLASAGQRFENTRAEIVKDAELAEHDLRPLFASYLEHTSEASTRLLSLMAWTLLGLDALPELRGQISRQALSASDSVAAFSRLIAGLVSLIFEVADAAIDPHISPLLVAFFNSVQGKELAGQERAVGGLSFAAGVCDSEHQQRVLHLIDAQERSFQVFSEFAEPEFVDQWNAIQTAPYVARLERLRRVLLSAKPGTTVNSDLSDEWFQCCSERLVNLWALQRAMIEVLQARCASLIAAAERDLKDAEGLLTALKTNPPVNEGLIDRFFDPAIPVEQSLRFMPSAGQGVRQGEQSIIEVLQQQSQKLATMESELATARRALDERKTIERAKGALMVRLNLSEADAYKKLRTESMEQNRRLVDVAEAALSILSR